VLLQEIGERFVREFLNSAHPVARELLQFVESVVIEGDQFAYDRPSLLRRSGSIVTDGKRSGTTDIHHC
jgi:hypothetical protein